MSIHHLLLPLNITKMATLALSWQKLTDRMWQKLEDVWGSSDYILLFSYHDAVKVITAHFHNVIAAPQKTVPVHKTWDGDGLREILREVFIN